MQDYSLQQGIIGATENAGAENTVRSKTREWKTQKWKRWHQNACFLAYVYPALNNVLLGVCYLPYEGL